MSADGGGFRRVQEEFCAHLRDPARHPRPADVDERRMRVYRDLFFRNVLGLIRASFPVLARVLEADALAALARAFFAEHACRTPYFHRFGREFADFLAARGPAPGEPPFLAELADYEWLGTELATRDGDAAPPAGPPAPDGADPLDCAAVLNPHRALRAYAWPVHRIRPGWRPDAPPDAPTFLLVHRGPDRVRHLELSAGAARLLARLETHSSAPLRSQLEAIAGEMPQLSPASVAAAGAAAIAELRAAGVITGLRAAAA